MKIIILLLVFAIGMIGWLWNDLEERYTQSTAFSKVIYLTFNDSMFEINATKLNQAPLVEADYVLVKKSIRKLFLFRDKKPFRVYHVAFGDNPIGHKHQEGDEKTPEGEYIIDWRNPNSIAYLSLHISYPNSADKAWAKENDVNPGGDIMIHGIYNKYLGEGKLLQMYNWTNGCIGVLNKDMDEIWKSVNNGTPIRIDP